MTHAWVCLSHGPGLAWFLNIVLTWPTVASVVYAVMVIAISFIILNLAHPLHSF